MTIRRMPARLSGLPIFTYSRAAKDAMSRHSGRTRKLTAKEALCKAVSCYEGEEDYTRRISENMIDTTRWKGRKRPRSYPAGLGYPADMLRAVLYSKRGPQGPKRCRKSRRIQVAEGKELCVSCDTMADTIDELCKCTTTPWDAQKTEYWQKRNVELKWASDLTGVGTYALQAFKKDFVLGEYIGELVHSEDNNSSYLFDVSYDKGSPPACLDSLRAGNWTRFINHSCDPNTQFVDVRVGEEVKYIVQTEKKIGIGEEMTVHYGHSYWMTLNEKDVWCACGARVCKYDKNAWKARADRARKARISRAKKSAR